MMRIALSLFAFLSFVFPAYAIEDNDANRQHLKIMEERLTQLKKTNPNSPRVARLEDEVYRVREYLTVPTSNRDYSDWDYVVAPRGPSVQRRPFVGLTNFKDLWDEIWLGTDEYTGPGTGDYVAVRVPFDISISWFLPKVEFGWDKVELINKADGGLYVRKYGFISSPEWTLAAQERINPLIGLTIRRKIMKGGQPRFELGKVQRLYQNGLVEIENDQILPKEEYAVEAVNRLSNRKALIINPQGQQEWVELEKFFNDGSAYTAKYPYIPKANYHIQENTYAKGATVLFTLGKDYKTTHVKETFLDGAVLTESGRLLLSNQYLAPLIDHKLQGQTIYITKKRLPVRVKSVYRNGIVLTEEDYVVQEFSLEPRGGIITCAQYMDGAKRK